MALFNTNGKVFDVPVDILKASLAFQAEQGVTDVFESNEQIINDLCAMGRGDSGDESGGHIRLQHEWLGVVVLPECSVGHKGRDVVAIEGALAADPEVNTP